MGKHVSRWAILIPAVFAVAGCATSAGSPGGATSAPATVPAAEHTAACNGLADGKAGQWSQAQTEWLAAQAATGDDLQANVEFLNLNLDSAALAIDTVSFTGGAATPKPADVAAYQRDLAALPAGILAGC